MKKQLKLWMGLIAVGLVFSSCTHRLIGLWQVENYEIISTTNESVTATNIGTVSFAKDGSGQKELSFSILGLNQQDKSYFSWVLNDKLLTITGDSSEFAKTWIVVEDKRKYQKLKSTDGGQLVQVMELKKIKLQ